MHYFSKTAAIGVVAAALALVTGSAIASHGKAGMWNVDMTIAGQNSQQMPAAALDRMKAAGMMPNAAGGFTIKRCMTAAEVADDSKMVDTSALKDCQQSNRAAGAHSVSVDMVCKGQVNGTAHVAVNYDTDSHYTGELKIVGTAANGQAVNQDQRFEGRWVSASCGSGR